MSVNLAKILGGPESEHLGWATTRRTAMAVVGWAWKGIGLGSESDFVKTLQSGHEDCWARKG